MSANPDTANIVITDAASEHIHKQLQLTQAQFLRLGIKESGCNGFQYTLDFLEQPAANDLKFEFGEHVRICVDPEHLQMVEGTEVDMITEGLNSALVFKNPRATSYCGCGESFAFAGDGQADPTTQDANAAGDLATDVGGS